eukprot:6469897-Amphidinium_carterae.1
MFAVRTVLLELQFQKIRVWFLSCWTRPRTVAEFVWAGPDPNTRDLRMRVVSKHPILVDDVVKTLVDWTPHDGKDSGNVLLPLAQNALSRLP